MNNGFQNLESILDEEYPLILEIEMKRIFESICIYLKNIEKKELFFLYNGSSNSPQLNLFSYDLAFVKLYTFLFGKKPNCEE